MSRFLSTLSLRRATVFRCVCFWLWCISIHALLAESDDCNTHIENLLIIISIHALLAESDHHLSDYLYLDRHFYPRSPCGERHGPMRKGQVYYIISIHALLAESDLWVLRKVPILGIFLSTLSLRRATFITLSPFYDFSNFYPRSPCGERPRGIVLFNAATLFLSTLSLRRATNVINSNSNFTQFLSTLSLRRATMIHHAKKKINPISIHALLAESDDMCQCEHCE